MPAWWGRLIASPRALGAVGVGVVLLVVLLVTAVVGSGEEDDGPSSSQGEDSPSAPEDTGPEDSPEDDESPSEADPVLPPDPDVYCPAFAQIQEGGLAGSGGEEDESVDLAELSQTFDTLLTRYGQAERVAPLELREDYAQALGYLRQGKRATESGDVELLKALVVNLESLNDSMETIQSESESLCG